MAKAISKPATTEKKAVKTKVAKPAADIGKVSEVILEKLKELGIEEQLQADLAWCIGSYQHDGNPVGLIENAGRALEVLKAAHATKTKGITAKLIKDIEEAIASK
jgi:hypothetical protein